MDANTKDAITRGAKALDAASFAMSVMSRQEAGPLADMFAMWLMEEAQRLEELVKDDIEVSPVPNC
ncbi:MULTISPECIES: hypothetical protein [Coriobacteriia]|uniref:hypothetical protein n=1 Tax=Coriobacteriia TaxID=84998 RepID=UPI0023F389CF|nr:hypothetical protein [Parvibacter caecicola]